MLYKKKGFPEDSELVLCTVTNVQYHSVFVKLDEYDKQGMIHISEVSAGRIRNMNDYVKVGKKVVCKVLRVNTDRGHIDLSLRRVSEGQRREKVDELKQEQKAEKIVETVARELNTTQEKLYNELSKKIISEDIPYLHMAFNMVVEDNLSLEQAFNIPKKEAEILEKIIRERIKPKEIVIGGNLTIKNFEPEGVEIIKNALLESINIGCEITYLGGGHYNLEIKDTDYKDAEAKLQTINKYIEEQLKGSQLEFKRIEKS